MMLPALTCGVNDPHSSFLSKIVDPRIIIAQSSVSQRIPISSIIKRRELRKFPHRNSSYHWSSGYCPSISFRTSGGAAWYFRGSIEYDARP